MQAVIFCDDLHHPAGVVRAGMAPFARDCGFNFQWVENAERWNPESLRTHQVALLSKSNVIAQNDKRPWLHSGSENVFLEYVRNGGGLLVVHSGTASYANIAPMRAVTGGTFLSHPPECEVTVDPLMNHPLTTGIADPFTIWDEHYFMALDDPAADVFMHTRSVHGVQPAGWTRKEGEGRVCVLTPGHTLNAWQHPSFQILLRNALCWIAQL